MLGGLPAVMLIIAKLLKCIKPHSNESIGGIIAIIGVILMMLDGSGQNLSATSIIIGDAIAVCSSIILAFYMVFVGPVLKEFPLSIMITISGLFTFLAAFAAMLTGYDGAIILSTDPHKGFLGGITKQY